MATEDQGHTEERGSRQTETFTDSWTPKTCSWPSESQVWTPVPVSRLKETGGRGLSDPDLGSCSHFGLQGFSVGFEPKPSLEC